MSESPRERQDLENLKRILLASEGVPFEGAGERSSGCGISKANIRAALDILLRSPEDMPDQHIIEILGALMPSKTPPEESEAMRRLKEYTQDFPQNG